MTATIVPIDDFSPIIAGDTGNPFIIRVLHKNGSMDLTGATITMKMQSVSDPTVVKTCTGPWIVAPDGKSASYGYQANDVNTADSWYMWIKVTIAGKSVHPDDGSGTPKILVIEPLPAGV
jgi:hypothetical protein